MRCLILLLAVTGVLLLCDSSYGHTYGDMEKLYKHLFNGTYNKNFRPLFNQSEIMQVNFTHVLSSVEHFDIQTGELVTLSVFAISWYDEMLTWDPSYYGNISVISLPKDRIWKPKIALGNGYSNKDVYIDESDFSPTWVTNDGFVNMYPAGNFNTKCKIDTTLYPLDSHECEYMFVLGNHKMHELNINVPSGSIDMSGFVENGEWLVDAKECMTTFVGFSEDFIIPAVRSTIILNRRPWFQLIMYATPIFLLWFLILMSCYIPPSCGERLTYVVTVYLAFVFLFLAIEEDIPKNSLKLPWYVYENVIMNFMNILAIMYNIYILCLVNSSRGETWAPNALKKMALKDKKMKSLHQAVRLSNKGTVATEDDNLNDAFAVESPDNIESDDLNTLTGFDIAETSDKLYFRLNLMYYILFIIANTVVLSTGPLKK